MAGTSKASLLIVFVVVFIDLLGFGIVLPLLPRYGEHFQASKPTLGLLMASFSAMQFLFAPIWGRVSDHVGRRPILILGLVGTAVSYALFGYATSLGKDGTLLGLSVIPWLFITRIGAGIAGATIPTAQAYIADVTGAQDRAKGMALIGAAFGIGFTFGPLIGAAFVSSSPEGIPSSAPGYVGSALSACALLAAIFLLPESLRGDVKAPSRGWFDFATFRQAISRPSIGVILLVIFLSTFGFAQFESTLALLTKSFGLADRANFFVFAYIGFILMMSQGVIVRRLVPRVGEFRMAIAGAVLMAVGLLCIGLATHQRSAPLLFTVLPICVMGFSAITPSIYALLSLRSAESDQGGILGVGQSMSALARIAGPVVGLSLLEYGPEVPSWSGAGIVLVSSLFILTLRRDPARPAS